MATSRFLVPNPPLPPSLSPTSFGTYYYLDSGRYEGEWVDDRIHGKGKPVYANGNVYDGEWLDGRIQGYGTLTYADGDKYIGQWQDGKMNGQGTYIYADGDKYEGEWKDDKRHGKGTVTYRGQDGSVVEQFQVRLRVGGERASGVAGSRGSLLLLLMLV